VEWLNLRVPDIVRKLQETRKYVREARGAPSLRVCLRHNYILLRCGHLSMIFLGVGIAGPEAVRDTIGFLPNF